MTADEETPVAEGLTPLLVACDEELAAGKSPADSSLASAPPELRADLERGLACMRLLRQILRPRETVDAAAAPLPFLTVDRFQIRQELGRGSFGLVFLAYDPRLCREVALKVPRGASVFSRELRERFLREARSAAKLEHPNLVAVYETGETDGLLFIASAYCPGPTLAAWLKEANRRLPTTDAAALVATLADAVHYAHTRGVLHRDLKPANILLQSHSASASRPDTVAGQPTSVLLSEYVARITDFGLAKVFTNQSPPAALSDASLTLDGNIVGTPNYMAPEQACGQGKNVGPEADVYALGAIFYELLTGRPPFEGEDVLATLEQVRSLEPQPPSRLRPGLPRDLETICLKCLAKEPRRRYHSAQALAQDLRRFLAGESVVARPASAFEKLVKWARRRPAAAALISVSLLATLCLVGVIGGYTVRLRNALTDTTQARTEALDRAREARRHLYVSDINLAQRLWKAGHARQALDLLAGHRPAPGDQDLCGFEWRYLWQLTHGADRWNLGGRDGEPCCAVFSPDGTTLAVARKARPVELWDCATRRLRIRFPDPSTEVEWLAFSPDGWVVAGACADGTVRLWDLLNGHQRAPLIGHRGKPFRVAFSPSRKLLASADAREVRVWDLATGKVRMTMTADGGPISAMVFASTEDTLAYSAGRTWYVWDCLRAKARPGAETTHPVLALAFARWGMLLLVAESDGTLTRWSGNQCMARLRVAAGPVRAVAPSPDDRTMAVGGDDGSVRIVEVPTGQEHLILRGHTDRVGSVAFTPNGRLLASASRDGTVKLWELNEVGQDAEPPEGVLPRGGPVALAPDGKTIALACRDATIRLLDVATWREQRSLRDYAGDVRALVFSADGKALAAGCDDARIRIWDTAQGQLRTALSGPQEVVAESIAFSPDGMRLAATGADRGVKVWDLSKPNEPTTIGPLTHMIAAVAFAPDGRRLAYGAGADVILWDLVAEKEQLRFPHGGPPSALAFSRDGRTAATARGQLVFLWDRAGGRNLARTLEHSGAVRSLAFSPDDRTLASADEGGTVVVWNLPALSPRCRITGAHGTGRCSVAFLLDKRLLTHGEDGSIRVSDLARWTVHRPAGQLPRAIRAVAFSPDGKRLVISSGADPTSVRIWPVPGATWNALQPLSGTGEEPITVWDVTACRPVRTFSQPYSLAITCLATSACGNLAAGTSGGSVWQWDLATGKKRPAVYLGDKAHRYWRGV
ncbi:MAG TPA: protein kinase, partial [Gemmataceae bacterium]|nr:protein kinase [Gemmataceae bacterium]